MQISVASGKGGTGKTTVAVSLFLVLASAAGAKGDYINAARASSLDVYPQNIQFLDCDVEEPNAHIFLKPRIEESHSVSILVPEVNEKCCSHCGLCAEVCAFHAILAGKVRTVVFEELCHGCGACSLFCPEKAIDEKDRNIGVIETGTVGRAKFTHGILNPGEALATPLISAVRSTVQKDGIVIIDAPPGTSCTMVESVKNTDFCILVTEPTPFGLHDLVSAFEVTQKLKVPAGVVINRSGIGDGGVEEFCQKRNIPILLRIPFDREIAEAYAEGKAIVSLSSKYLAMFRNLWDKICSVTAINTGSLPC